MPPNARYRAEQSTHKHAHAHTHTHTHTHIARAQDLGGSVFLCGLLMAVRHAIDVVGNVCSPLLLERLGSPLPCQLAHCPNVRPLMYSYM